MTASRARGKASVPVTVLYHLPVTATVISMVASSVTKVITVYKIADRCVILTFGLPGFCSEGKTGKRDKIK